MRLFPSIALLLGFVGAPAAAQQSSGPPATSRELEITHINFESGTLDISWTRDRGASDRKLAVPVDVAWAAFPIVFGELGIEPNVVDPKQLVFGNAGATYRHKLADKRISHFINCGNIVGVGTADTYEIHVRVISQLLPIDGGKTKLRTEVEATARAADLPGGYMRCSSNGLLESRIAALLSEEAAKATK